MENKLLKRQNMFFRNMINFIKKHYIHILISFFSVFLVAILGSLFTNPNSAWFNSLVLPSFYPPSILFSIVWSILYVLIGVGLYFVLQKGITKNQIILYAVNGFLNILWTLVFFRFNSLIFSVVILVVLIIFAYFLLKSLYETNKLSFYLTLPYFIWLFFAFLLNYSIYFLN